MTDQPSVHRDRRSPDGARNRGSVRGRRIFDASGLGHRVDALPLADSRARHQVRKVLQELVDLAEFRVGAVSVVREDGFMQVAEMVGTVIRDEELQGLVSPQEVWSSLLARSERHGGWLHLPTRSGEEIDTAYTWVPDVDPASGAPDGAWQTHDVMNYPIYDTSGQVAGMLALDVPLSGLRPDEATWVRLDKLARIAGSAVLAILERERQAERARLAEAARSVLRRASGELPPAEALGRARESIEYGLSADRVHYQLFDEWGTEAERSVIALCEAPLIEAWNSGEGALRLVTADPATIAAVVETEAEAAELATQLTRAAMDNVLLVPVGAGHECYGALAVARSTTPAPWSEIETRAVVEIARDLGRSISTFHAQEREHQLVLDLQRVADYKTRLVATVSHDLVSPISAIRLHLDMLEQTGADADLVPHAVQVMKRATQELLYSVEGLVALYRADASRLPRERVDLRMLLRHAVDVHRPLAEKAGLVLIDESGASDAVVIHGNPAELGRVLANLIGNAVKYTLAGSVKVAVTREDGAAVFTVRDTGVGMSQEDQGRVFEEFFRSSDPQVRNLPGTGLGMAIVARIVENHGGTVALDSAPGRGTRVQVCLPTV